MLRPLELRLQRYPDVGNGAGELQHWQLWGTQAAQEGRQGQGDEEAAWRLETRRQHETVSGEA